MSKIVIGELSKSLSVVSVIMAGGVGTRFWPSSRISCPKQYLSLVEPDKSLIQATAERLEPLSGAGGLLIVTSQNQTKLVQKQLPSACILAEPSGRNTAPCVGLAAMQVLDTVGDVPMLCLPADHVIDGADEITKTYQQGIEIALKNDVLVTIGIKPHRPETGYGYIQRGSDFGGAALAGTAAFKVSGFVEKPNLETAQSYLDSGDYFWNSGMFVWRPSVVLSAIEKFVPEVFLELQKIRELLQEESKSDQLAEIYSKIPSVSIDVGVMEKADNTVMLMGDSFVWSDVGAWDSWAELEGAKAGDENGNVVKGELIGVDIENCAVIGDKRLIAAVGVKDLVIVDTEDALLVCHKDHAQSVKTVVDKLIDRGRKDLL